MVRVFQTLALGLVALTSAVCADPIPKDDQTCNLCKQYMAQIHDKDVREQVYGLLDKVCGSLPIFQDECSQFAQQLKDEIDTLSKEDPEQACEELQLCGHDALQIQAENHVAVMKSTIVSKMTKLEEKANDAQCNFCEWLWGMVEQQAPPAKQIEEKLDAICDMAPPESQDQCMDAVKKIEDQYRRGIKMSPKEACTMLHVCPEETSLLRQLVQSLKTHTH
eukprot:CFRG4845T1